MISALQLSTSTQNMNLILNPPKVDFSTARDSLADISNTVVRPPTGAPVIDTRIDDWLSLLSHSHHTIHLGRVATVDCHDMDAWVQGRNVHDPQLSAVTTSSFLGSNGTAPDGWPPVGGARNCFALMGSQAQGLWTVEQFSNAVRLGEDTVHPHNCPSLVASGSGISPFLLNEVMRSNSREDLSEGRRRVGEILVRCGVIDGSGMSPIELMAIGCSDTSDPRPVDTPMISRMTSRLPSGEGDERLITALVNWTSEWLRALVIRPYIHGRFRFQYQGTPSRASDFVASRIRRVLDDMKNPLQVTIHALWFISVLTESGAHDNTPFLSIPIFRYLHNNGTIFAEDFMFRIFATCAMISDKSVNDTTLSTSAWNRLSRIPQVVLNATERYTLSCLRWNVVMTRDQWEETIIYFRSCIKMGSTFDPFGYDTETSPSGIMACCLDELINLSYADEIRPSRRSEPVVEILAPQPIRHFTHWEIFDTEEWCPADDPVINHKPRIVGIAPGSDQASTPKVGTTAKDLLDSILGVSSDVPDLAHPARLVGTSFRGPFGAIGARLVQTVKLASACQSTSWFPSQC